MRIWISGLLAAGVLASVDAASAEPEGGELYAVFAEVCLAHDNDDIAAEAKAVALGFEPVTARKPLEGERFLVRGEGADRIVVRVADVPEPNFAELPDAWMRICSAAQAGENRAAAKSAIAWAAVPLTFEKDDVKLYIYRQTKTGRAPISFDQSPAAVQAAVRAGEVRTVTLKVASGETNLMLASARAPR